MVAESMTRGKERYGTMLPGLGRMDLNRPLAGKEFEVLAEGRGIGVSWRQVTVRRDRCVASCMACENHRNCHDLSVAKLALATGLGARA